MPDATIEDIQEFSSIQHLAASYVLNGTPITARGVAEQTQYLRIPGIHPITFDHWRLAAQAPSFRAG